jgi:hypothetical protein
MKVYLNTRCGCFRETEIADRTPPLTLCVPIYRDISPMLDPPDGPVTAQRVFVLTDYSDGIAKYIEKWKP